MSTATSSIIDIGPICSTDTSTGAHRRTPNPALFSNIPLQWQFLELTTQDWHNVVIPFQMQVNSAESEGVRFYHILHAFNALRVHYLKSLFSYVMFFVALEHTYDLFHKELGTLQIVFPQAVLHPKPPRTPYIRKVRQIRNISIAHIGSTWVSPINSAAAIMWEPLTLSSIGDIPDLERLTFGGARLNYRDSSGNLLAASDDLEVIGITEMHQNCINFLTDYDQVCTDYLRQIASYLPVTINNVEYSLLPRPS